MIQKAYIDKLDTEMYYIGNLDILSKRCISIVGTRHPNQYTQIKTKELSSKLASIGICLVSGCAMGVDSIVHNSAGYDNTVGVVANGLDIRYPAVNKKMIEQIEKQGLMLSSFPLGHTAREYNFVQRNKTVVELGEVLVVAQADMNSGSMRSVEFARKLGKQIYVLPHRIGESEGTNYLLKNDLAKPIYDIDEFVALFGSVDKNSMSDEFLEFCKTNPTYDDAVALYGTKVFEYELMGKIDIINGVITIV